MVTEPLRSRAVVRAVAGAVLALAAADPLPAQRAGVGEAVRERIRVLVESRSPGQEGEAPLQVGGERLHAAEALTTFYERRIFHPAWIGSQGGVTPRARELLAAIRGADGHGLRPEDYRAARLDSLLTGLRSDDRGERTDERLLAEADLLLTDAFLTYGSHLLSGRVDPRTIDPLWTAAGRGADLPALLERAISEGRVRPALDELAPGQREYGVLQGALRELRDAASAGGWGTVSAGPPLREGDEGERVAAVARRLSASGDLPVPEDTAAPPPDRFDPALDSAVRRFQRRHGLEADGVVGDSTRAALNVPVERRIEQIELNLERWRWMPADLGERHIRVNIASFEMEVREGDSTALRMRAIVGRHYRQTPVFSDTVRYVVVNPSWNVPTSIAVNDILPRVKESPSYLSQQGMQVFRGWGSEAAPVDPSTVDWASLGADNFPYRFVQRPGPLNALGQVKFMFPNRFSVYLHDTPARGLFSQSVRSFSSGCIRLERPLELLDYLFRGSESWTPTALRETVGSTRERTIRLPRLIPVHLQYWTAWAEEDGSVHFRRDIYGRDARLAKALGARPPGE